MGKLPSRLNLVALLLFFSACRSSEPVVPGTSSAAQSQGTQTPSHSQVATSGCEDLPSDLGRPESFPAVELPGPARAMVVSGTRTWVCGALASGTGYLVRLDLGPEGAPRLIKQQPLNAPCRGVSLGDKGVAVWLASNQVAWWSDGQVSLEGPPLQIDLDSQLHRKEPTRPLRAVWSSADRAFFLAGGSAGVIRLNFKDGQLHPDPHFQGPESTARDLIVLDSKLFIADPERGVLVWDIGSAELVHQWKDGEIHGPMGVQRIVVGPEGISIGAGLAGSYRMRWDSASGRLEELVHHSGAGSAIDVLSIQARTYALGPTRVHVDGALVEQRFPELEGQQGFVALAPDPPSGGIWLLRENRLERRPPLASSSQARLLPLIAFASARAQPNLQSGDEIAFEVRGEGRLWIQAPELIAGQGLALDLVGWPPPHPHCPGHYLVSAGTRLSIRVRVTDPGQVSTSARILLRSTDRNYAEQNIPVFAALGVADPVDKILSEAKLVRARDGYLGQLDMDADWTWVEFVPVEQMGDPSFGQTLEQLVSFVEQEKRNGKFVLKVAVVLGGSYESLELSAIAPISLASESGIEFYLDERFALYRGISSLPNGRFYPLRFILNKNRKISYYDQNLGLASARAKYRALKLGEAAILR